MWTVFVFLILWLLRCTVSSSLPSPINVVFSSVNLKNVLSWSPGNGTPSDTYFTVQYAIYGDTVETSKGKQVHWRTVQQCTKIVRNWCDLSNETWDIDQGYYAKVRAVGWKTSSKWALTHRRFDPKLDTSFGPPLVSVEKQNDSATVTLKGPMRYLPNNNMPVVSMASVYPYMAYNLSIHNARCGTTHNILLESSSYKFHLMEYDTEYCFSAKARFLSMPVQCHSSEWLCITTPQDPVIGQLQRVVVSIVVPSLCACALLLVGYFLCNYLMGKGQKSPYILNPPTFHPPPLMFPNPENLNTILMIIKPSSDKEPLGPVNCPDPPPSYSPQRSETPSEPKESSGDSLVDYGFVGIAPKINVIREEEERENGHGRGDDENELKAKCQKCGARNSFMKKEWTVEDSQFTGFYAAQARPCLPLRSTIVPIHTQTEMCTPAQAHAWSQLNSGLLTETQGISNSWECTGLFINKNPQTGLFHIPLSVQTNKEAGMGGNARVGDEKLDGDAEGGSKSEKVPLLSAYTSQNATDMPPFHTEQSDFLPDDYGVLRLATAQSVVEEEEDDDDYYEEEEGTISINWDNETRKLVLPKADIRSNKQRDRDGLMQGETGRKEWLSGEDEEVKVTKGVLRLENLFVRQPSEEEEAAGAPREMGGGGATGCEVDNFMTKWNLVILEDQ